MSKQIVLFVLVLLLAVCYCVHLDENSNQALPPNPTSQPIPPTTPQPAPNPLPPQPVPPIPQPAPHPPQPVPNPPQPIIPFLPLENYLEWQIIQSKEAIPHSRASSVRLYIYLKPHIIKKTPAPIIPTVICSPPKVTPSAYTWWDWILNNNFLLVGTLDLLTYLNYKSKEVELEPSSCIYPLPNPEPPVYIFKNVQVKVELLHSQMRLQKVSNVHGIPILSSKERTESNQIGILSHFFHFDQKSTVDGHIVLDFNVPDHFFSVQNLAKISVTYDGMPKQLAREEIISIQRQAPLLSSRLPLEIVYYPTSSYLSAQNEHYVHVELSLRRVEFHTMPATLPNRNTSPVDLVEGMLLVFQKESTHSISPSFIPMRFNGNKVYVNLMPWQKGETKRVAFDVRIPPTTPPTAEVIMKNPKVLYTFRTNNYKYPMEIELLERIIFR